MTPLLSSAYCRKTASNPNARNREPNFLPPKALGTRRLRRKIASLLRKGVPLDAILKGTAA